MITLHDPNTVNGYKSALVKFVELHGFKRRWPCHGIPDEIEAIVFEYASNGDLVDVTYLEDEEDRTPAAVTDEETEAMGAAMVALAEDVKAFLFHDTVPGWAW